jgi:RNA polymerase sigma factor (sigma-70 family)
LASWLRVVTARLTIDFLRKQKVSTVEVPDELPSSDPDPSLALIDHEREKSLLEAIQNLSHRDRLFLDLHYRKGLPPEEIASLLQVAVNAVYTQKSRLLAKLRESLIKVEAG